MAFEPITFGLFTIDASARMGPGPNRPSFSFTWRDRAIAVEIADDLLWLHVMLGRIPSSTRPPWVCDCSEPEQVRDTLFHTVRLLRHALPPSWQMRLLPDHRVELRAEVHLALPASAVSLLVAVTRFLLTLAPYLDLLDEDGMPTAGPMLPAGPAASGITNA